MNELLKRASLHGQDPMSKVTISNNQNTDTGNVSQNNMTHNSGSNMTYNPEGTMTHTAGDNHEAW